MEVIDVDRAEAVASVIRRLEIKREQYLDQRLYPPPDDPLESQLAYFVSMVAIDHRTSLWEPFEGEIEGEFFHGADALYRLGRIAYDKGFFKAEKLARLTPSEAELLLSLGGKRVWDFHTRVLLLRDVGRKAMLRGGFEKLVSRERISDLQKSLKDLRAYEDPVGKKVMLLAKFLDGRRLADFRDLNEADVPVDNHLSRVAYRLGIVDINYDFLESGVEVTREEDIRLREAVKTAWRIVAKFADIHPFALDDYLWSFGRKICIRESPKCDICPLKEVCKAYSLSRFPPEHLHTITWYY
ncbi:iron-sulfur cluster loop [Pyrobaculum islandicum DSM 4184]|uniref:Iron-sulfur cluster loop n=1 Tax=Pyrobaculum islandicum (strain DSM 4184 / JCM 9189 / GEO3) TaxID=384616 RepID=A1RT39_PYRIL|nr:N-glycosylase/DNA lyase [Pyrobaculum islandicum]ABL88121.1 iron-sulfur cluster loop [Pyrobaculum islandicum DSM 4184]